MHERLLLLRRLLFWGAVLGVAFFALLPPPHAVHIAPWDKIDHLFAFVVLAALAIIAYPRRSALTLGLVLVAFGGSLELVQATNLIHRDPSLNDWLVDILGAGLGIVAVMLFRAMLGARPNEPA